jgi:hypothetical protein
MAWIGLEKSHKVGFCEHGNEPAGCKKAENFMNSWISNNSFVDNLQQ